MVCFEWRKRTGDFHPNESNPLLFNEGKKVNGPKTQLLLIIDVARVWKSCIYLLIHRATVIARFSFMKKTNTYK